MRLPSTVVDCHVEIRRLKALLAQHHMEVLDGGRSVCDCCGEQFTTMDLAEDYTVHLLADTPSAAHTRPPRP